MQPVVRHVERRILDALPGAIDPGLLQAVLEREVQLEVERVAIATDAPGVAGIDRLLDVRKENRGVRVEDLAVGEHVMRRTIEQRPGVLAIDGAIEEVEHESLHVLGGVDPQAIDTDDLDQPLCRAHEISGRVLLDRVARLRIVQVERVHRDVLLARSRVEHANGPMSDVRIEAPVSRIGCVRNPAECRHGARGQVLRIARRDRAADEAMVLLVGDVDQTGQALAFDAAGKGGVEVAVDIVWQREGKSRVPARLGEAGSSEVREAVVIDDVVDVHLDAGAVQHRRERLQAVFGAVQRRVRGLPQIEPIVDVVADAEPSLVGAVRRRQPHEAVASHEDVRETRLDRLVGRFEPLEDRRRRLIDPLHRRRRRQQRCRCGERRCARGPSDRRGTSRPRARRSCAGCLRRAIAARRCCDRTRASPD